MKKKPPWRLTHHLTHARNSDTWECACGYKLGDGRKQFLAQCPKSKEAYIDFDISSDTNEKPREKTKTRKRKTGGGKRGVSKAASDLFSC